MIHTIVFDMGQVLIRWDPMTLFGLTEEEKQYLLPELFQNVEWIQIDRGIITPEEAVRSVCARLPEKFHNRVRHFVLHWHDDHLIPMPGMGELVRELKENGYRILLLSNAGDALRSYFPRIPGAECFDGLMVSAEEKLLKPQHEIYERLYSRFHVCPEECIFIDDSPANVEGAILTGMQAVIFRGDVSALRRQLRAAGVTCKE